MFNNYNNQNIHNIEDLILNLVECLQISSQSHRNYKFLVHKLR